MPVNISYRVVKILYCKKILESFNSESIKSRDIEYMQYEWSSLKIHFINLIINVIHIVYIKAVEKGIYWNNF